MQLDLPFSHPLLQVRAAAATIEIPTSINSLTDEQRTKLANELGYQKIGKELPDNVTLNDIVRTLPKEVSSLC